MLSSKNLNKRKEADQIIGKYVTYTGGAGFIPIPIVDTLCIAGVQLTMIRKLAQLYELDFDAYRIKSVVGALVGSIGTTVSVFKFFPGLGTTLGIARISVVGAIYTYALGKVFTQHFADGGTLLDFDPVEAKKFFQQEMQKGKQLFLNSENRKAFFGNKSQKDIVETLRQETQQQYTDLLKIQEDLQKLLD